MTAVIRSRDKVMQDPNLLWHTILQLPPSRENRETLHSFMSANRKFYDAGKTVLKNTKWAAFKEGEDFAQTVHYLGINRRSAEIFTVMPKYAEFGDVMQSTFDTLNRDFRDHTAIHEKYLKENNVRDFLAAMMKTHEKNYKLTTSICSFMISVYNVLQSTFRGTVEPEQDSQKYGRVAFKKIRDNISDTHGVYMAASLFFHVWEFNKKSISLVSYDSSGSDVMTLVFDVLKFHGCACASENEGENTLILHFCTRVLRTLIPPLIKSVKKHHVEIVLEVMRVNHNSYNYQESGLEVLNACLPERGQTEHIHCACKCVMTLKTVLRKCLNNVYPTGQRKACYAESLILKALSTIQEQPGEHVVIDSAWILPIMDMIPNFQASLGGSLNTAHNIRDREELKQDCQQCLDHAHNLLAYICLHGVGNLSNMEVRAAVLEGGGISLFMRTLNYQQHVLTFDLDLDPVTYPGRNTHFPRSESTSRTALNILACFLNYNKQIRDKMEKLTGLTFEDMVLQKYPVGKYQIKAKTLSLCDFMCQEVYKCPYRFANQTWQEFKPERDRNLVFFEIVLKQVKIINTFSNSVAVCKEIQKHIPSILLFVTTHFKICSTTLHPSDNGLDEAHADGNEDAYNYEKEMYLFDEIGNHVDRILVNMIKLCPECLNSPNTCGHIRLYNEAFATRRHIHESILQRTLDSVKFNSMESDVTKPPLPMRPAES